MAPHNRGACFLWYRFFVHEYKDKNRMSKKGITGSTLKIIAVITMIIDHIGASVLELTLRDRGLLGFVARGLGGIRSLEGVNRVLVISWWVMRMIIGRVAFPIFCYLLVEGFLYTKSVRKYAGRLFLFAVISEVPFDLGIFQTAWYPQYQNVFFTLLTGLLCMQGFAWLDKKRNERTVFLIYVGKAAVLLAGMAAAWFFKTDYGAGGVIFILCLYIFRTNKALQLGIGCVVSMVVDEVMAPLAFLPVLFYRGERGLKLKYFFYAIYPIHLFLLYWICVILGLVKTS